MLPQFTCRAALKSAAAYQTTRIGELGENVATATIGNLTRSAGRSI